MDEHYPDSLRYTASHHWVRLEGDVATVGITWHGQSKLGDVVYVAPPEVGATVADGDSIGELESLKAITDIIAPMAGTVVAVNQSLDDAPEAVNADPYAAWLLRIEPIEPERVEHLLDATAYRSAIAPAG